MKCTALIAAAASAILTTVAPAKAAPMIYAFKANTGALYQYDITGTQVGVGALISGLNVPYDILSSGGNLFIASPGSGTIGEYTSTGAAVNTALISGLNQPYGFAISGSNIFVANYGSGTIGEYTLSGATVNAALITGLSNPFSIAVSGSSLFVAGRTNGTIGEYTTSGATVNAALITGLGNPGIITIIGSNLFVPDDGKNQVGEYTLSGAVVNASLVSGVQNPNWVVPFGSNILVGTNCQGIKEYTLSGTLVSTVVSGCLQAFAVADLAAEATAGAPVPEPTSLVLVGAGIAGLAVTRRRRPARNPVS